MTQSRTEEAMRLSVAEVLSERKFELILDFVDPMKARHQITT